jgi:peptidoglycan hydrolase-like protein with peptidoglycan-binding domain
LFALFIGVNDYKDSRLKLNYPAKDAKALQEVVEVGAKRFLGDTNVVVYLISSILNEETLYGAPEKESIRKALEEIGTMSKPEDIVMIFFAGHGEMKGTEEKLFTFLTAESTSMNHVGISTKDLQQELKDRGYYDGPISGIVGPLTRDAILRFVRSRADEVDPVVIRSVSVQIRTNAAIQLIFKDLGFYNGTIDGRVGPETRFATEQWQNRQRQTHLPARPATVNNRWPTRNQREAFYGQPGTGHTLLNIPYPMRIAWDTKQTVNRVTVHSKCADSLDRILKEILQVYGYDEIRKLGIDLFGGIYNNRPVRGGSALSDHAYAAAIDLDPERNQLRWGADRAVFARPVYNKMFDAFEREGWVSLGRERNFDWMHISAVSI